MSGINIINWNNPMQIGRNEAVYAFICRHYSENGYGPSFRKVRQAVGCNLENVGDHVRRLEELNKVSISRAPSGQIIPNSIVPKGREGMNLLFTNDEWHLMHAAWGDCIKEEILRAAEQTRFVVTA